MQASIATVTIEGMSPLSHSRDHGDPHLQGESHDAYDLRTWRSKLNAAERDGKMTVVIPAHGIHQALMSACKYSKDQIPGQGKATWTAKFTSGIAFFEDPSLNIDPETVKSIRLSQNADGVRGSARRVLRTFPIMPVWSSTFDVYILDPIITKDVFMDKIEKAGMFIGLGRFRPEKGGINGRFKVAALSWQDNRQIAA